MTELMPIPMAHRDTTVGFGKGWYCVAESDEISADAMKPVTYFDQELIVFRDADGKAHVSDAYCPHLGAHLASSDGCIKDNQIVCPFHRWHFDTASGKCSEIPYSKSIPPRAKLKYYPTTEMAGMVMMWWSETGEEPGSLPFDTMAMHADKTWLKSHVEEIETRVPLRDLPENIFDTAHIQQLHNSGDMPDIADIRRKEPGLEVDFDAFDGDLVKIDFMQFHFSGLGTVAQTVYGPNFGFMQVNSNTPIDKERSRLKIRMFVMDTGNQEMNDMVGKALADRTMMEIGQDLKVLDYKKHLAEPLICAGDGPIMRWREYARELYAA